VDTDRFFPADLKLAAKQEVRAPLDRPLILMLGNTAPHKGQATALRALAALRSRHFETACWLAGEERDGNSQYTDYLNLLAEDLGVASDVRFLGQRDDAPDLLRAADCFVLPSTCEGLPLSILEAQASKVPVLAAPIAGIPEVVHDGETGWLIAAQDFKGYANRIEKVLGNPKQVERLTKRAFEIVQQSFNWRAYCKRMVAIYQETADR